MRRAASIVVLGAVVASAAWGCGLLAGTRQSLDLNAAPAGELAAIAGVTPADVARIVANRPYWAKRDVLDRGIVSPAGYRQLASATYIGPPAMPDYARWVAPIP